MASPVIYWQDTITLSARKRGIHLITNEITNAFKSCPRLSTGLLNLFIQHTSASLTITENACPDVRDDLENAFNRIAPDDNALYRHTLEGEDDMPAHVKNALVGSSLSIPVNDHKLLLGQWQGIVLCEHRNHATPRHIVLTAHGQTIS